MYFLPSSYCSWTHDTILVKQLKHFFWKSLASLRSALFPCRFLVHFIFLYSSAILASLLTLFVIGWYILYIHVFMMIDRNEHDLTVMLWCLLHVDLFEMTSPLAIAPMYYFFCLMPLTWYDYFLHIYYYIHVHVWIHAAWWKHLFHR